jgi:hypothetical protein
MNNSYIFFQAPEQSLNNLNLLLKSPVLSLEMQSSHLSQEGFTP